MPWIRRRPRSDEIPPPLPDIDGEDVDDVPSAPDELPDADARVDLDDSTHDEPAAEHPELRDDAPANDDDEGPLDGGGDESIAGDDESTWVDEGERDAPPVDELVDDDGSSVDGDSGDEGPVDDLAAGMGELPPLDGTDDGADAEVDDPGTPDDAAAPPAFSLPPRESAVARAYGGPEGAVLVCSAVFCDAGQVLVVSDGLHRFAPGPPPDAPLRPKRSEPLPRGEVYTAVTSVDGVIWLGAESGRLVRSARRESWRPVGSLEAGVAALWGDGETLWALDGAGALYSVGDALEAVGLPGSVTAVATDPHGGMLLATTGARGENLHHCADGVWTGRSMPPGCVAAAVAVVGEIRAVAPANPAMPLWVSHDHGAHWTAVPALAGATALAIAETDDGAPGLVAAVHDPATGASTLVFTSLAAEGASAVFRFFDLRGDQREEDEDALRVELLRPLDRAARSLLIATADGRAWRVDRG